MAKPVIKGRIGETGGWYAFKEGAVVEAHKSPQKIQMLFIDELGDTKGEKLNYTLGASDKDSVVITGTFKDFKTALDAKTGAYTLSNGKVTVMVKEAENIFFTSKIPTTENIKLPKPEGQISAFKIERLKEGGEYKLKEFPDEEANGFYGLTIGFPFKANTMWESYTGVNGDPYIIKLRDLNSDKPSKK